MKWRVHAGDILDVPADVLVCSANVYLTLSGGVGGAFLQRYGVAMRDALFQHLAERGIRHVNQGDLICMPPCGSPYRAVFHAVAVDGVYDSTQTVVSNLVAASLQRASEMSAQTVCMSALATGYGRQPIDFFARALTPLMAADFSPVHTVVIGVRSPSDAEILRSLLPEIESV